MHYAALRAMFALRNSTEYFPCVVKMLCLYLFVQLCNRRRMQQVTQTENPNPKYKSKSKIYSNVVQPKRGIKQSAKRVFLACYAKTSSLALL